MLVWFFKVLGVFPGVLDSVQSFFFKSNLELISKDWLYLNFCIVFFSKPWVLWLLSWTDLSIVWRKPNDAPPTVVGFSRIIFIVFTIAWTRKRAVFTSFVKFKKERDSWRFRRTCSCSSGKKRRMLPCFWWSFPGALLVFGSFWRKDCGCMFFFRFLFTFE